VFDSHTASLCETTERQNIAPTKGHGLKRLEAGTRVSFENILVPTDFSHCSYAAISYALSIARKYGSKLFVTHVMSYPLPTPRGSRVVTTNRAERAAQKAMKDFVAQVEGTDHEVLLRRGDVWSTLSELIVAHQIDLIVVGTHGHSGVSKVLLGSVAEQVFRKAPCPVLTVGPDVSTDPKNIAAIHQILYPTDFKPESLAAAPYAISLAEENQAQLSLLHVIESRKEDPSAELFAHRLYDLIPYRVGLLCRPIAFIKDGPAAKAILEAEHERGADLIVLGVKRADRFPAVLMHSPRSKALRIVAHAHCPVLTVCG